MELVTRTFPQPGRMTNVCCNRTSGLIELAKGWRENIPPLLCMAIMTINDEEVTTSSQSLETSRNLQGIVD